ncbi:MAG: type II toxin-antitoxin system RelE/ParE family toxin [Acidobacteriia bacterium]|nr:type II toxin-antitoxin system RelE/ParE family toxin [Terriglobia bacterium]
MVWIVEYDPGAEKDLRRLDKSVQREILDYLDNRIAREADPQRFGKPLRHSRYGLWRYRGRDYRIVCEIQPKRRVVLVVAVGHRRSVYE